MRQRVRRRDVALGSLVIADSERRRPRRARRTPASARRSRRATSSGMAAAAKATRRRWRRCTRDGRRHFRRAATSWRGAAASRPMWKSVLDSGVGAIDLTRPSVEAHGPVAPRGRRAMPCQGQGGSVARSRRCTSWSGRQRRGRMLHRDLLERALPPALAPDPERCAARRRRGGRRLALAEARRRCSASTAAWERRTTATRRLSAEVSVRGGLAIAGGCARASGLDGLVRRGRSGGLALVRHRVGAC